VILTVIGLMIALAIPNLVRARLDANFAAAKASVRTISTAIETYAAANNGKYPDSEYELVYKNPAYLSQSYNEKEIAGYRYFLDLATNTYKIVAEPVSCNVTGNKVIVLEKGGELQEKDCK
jgi:type II secretory pathway pseudopilin PulG